MKYHNLKSHEKLYGNVNVIQKKVEYHSSTFFIIRELIISINLILLNKLNIPA